MYKITYIRKQLTRFLHNKQGEPKTKFQLQDNPNLDLIRKMYLLYCLSVVARV